MSRSTSSLARLALTLLLSCVMSAAALPMVGYGGAPPGQWTSVDPPTVYVDLTGDDDTGDGSVASPYLTIRKGLAEAQSGERVLVGPGTYTEDGAFPLILPGGVTLESRDGRDATTIQADGDGSVMEIKSFTANTVLRGFTLTGGNAPTVGGGGIDMRLPATGTPADLWPLIEGCRITGNDANYGGGVLCDGWSGKTVTPRFVDMEISDNTAERGGGFEIGSNAKPTFEGCEIRGNYATTSGGGVNGRSALAFTRCMIADNSADTGGGVHVESTNFVGHVRFAECVIADNTARAGVGGGVRINASANEVAFTRTAITGNSALNDGGGTCLTNSAYWRFQSCLIAGNEVLSGSGGAVFVSSLGGELSLNGCTVADNVASGTDGISIQDPTNNVVAVIRNSVLWHGVPGDPASAQDLSGIGVEDEVSYSCIRASGYGGTGSIHDDPLFRDAAAGDYRLTAGSPCIDTANPVNSTGADYFGTARPVDGDENGTADPDMGFHEFAPNTAPVAAGDSYETTEDTTLTIAAPGVLGNDTDADDDDLTAVKVTDPTSGTLELKTDGSFTYAPKAGYTGTDTFTYKASDGMDHSNEATVTITVAEADEPLPAVIEVAGADRYATAVEASKLAYPDGAETVVIATGRNWPDALGGTALAGVLDGPILLVATDSVPGVTAAEIARLKATKAVILGGDRAVGETVASALQSSGLGVERIAGTSRYETADKVAARVKSELGEAYDGTAFVATGAKFPDALAAAPLAAAKGWPLLLAHPSAGLSDATKATMAGTKTVLVLGGPDVVSAATESYLKTTFGDASVTRLAGTSRYDTAAVVAGYGVANAGLSWNRVGITTGQKFPDALAGGVLQGKVRSVMLLTRTGSLEQATRDALAANKATISTVTYFGGELAVSAAVRAAVAQVLE